MIELINTLNIAAAFQDDESDLIESSTCQSQDIRGKELKKRKSRGPESEDGMRFQPLNAPTPQKKKIKVTETQSVTSTPAAHGSGSGLQTTQSQGMPLRSYLMMVSRTILCMHYLTLMNLWTEEMEKVAAEVDVVNEEFMVTMIELLESIIQLMKKETEDGRGDSSLIQSLLLCKNTYWSTSAEERALLRTLFTSLQTRIKEDQYPSVIEKSSTATSVSMNAPTSITTIASTSAAGTPATAAVPVSPIGVTTLSSTGRPSQSTGWTVKASTSSSFITWRTANKSYTVRHPENVGEFIAKVELYRRQDVEHLSPQEWWKYAIHRSRIQLNPEDPMGRILASYTSGTEKLWVDRETGVHRVPGIITEMSTAKPPPPPPAPQFNRSSGWS